MHIDRKFLGGAVIGKLTAELAGTDIARVLQINDLSGWDFPPDGVFTVAVSRGLPIEEKMLCVIGNRNPDGSGVLSVFVDNTNKVYRGWDNTSIQVHPVGARVEHVWSAIDATEVMAAVKALAAAPAHNHSTWRDLLATPVQPIP